MALKKKLSLIEGIPKPLGKLEKFDITIIRSQITGNVSVSNFLDLSLCSSTETT